MGGPRKPLQRGQAQFHQRNGDASIVNGVSQIKHVHLPPMPRGGCMAFHCLTFVFCLVATSVQYLNLYRTVWWLPKIKSKYIIDLSAIDYNLMVHNLLQLMAPPMFQTFRHFYFRPASFYYWLLLQFISCTCFAIWLSAQVYFVRAILFEYFLIPVRLCGILFLVYLPLVCLLFFYLDPIKKLYHNIADWKRTTEFIVSLGKHTFDLMGFATQFLRPRTLLLMCSQSLSNLYSICKRSSKLTVNRLPCNSSLFPTRYSTVSPSNFRSNEPIDASVLYQDSALFFTLRPQSTKMFLLKHDCSRSNIDCTRVRDEVDILSQDFNVRLMDTLVGTFYATFYSTVVPCFFIQPGGLNYDLYWCMKLNCITAFTVFLFHWQYLLPAAYLDLLHRSALHLGGWESCFASSGSVYWQVWSQLQIYSRYVHVKHIRGMFRAIEPSNAAEPGNGTHSRFYFWFYCPVLLPNLLCLLAFLIVLWALVSLEWVYEWYKLLGLAATSPFCLSNLYRLMRNLFLLTWAYDGDCFYLPDEDSNLSSQKARVSSCFPSNKSGSKLASTREMNDKKT